MADFLVLCARSSNSGLCSVQRKTAMPFLNLLRVMMFCARTSWEHLQETTEAPITKSYQSPTNKKLKYIIKTKESKLLADKDNLLNPRAAHTMLCLHMSNLLIGFPCLGTLVILKSEMEEKTSSLRFSSANITSPNIRSSKGKNGPRLATSRVKVHIHLTV